MHTCRDLTTYLRVINIANPTAPYAVASLDDGRTMGYALAVAGNYAFVAAAFDGLRMIDISNPVTREVGYLSDGTWEAAIDIDVAGHYVYI